MEWKTTWNDPLTSYVTAFDDLIGDHSNPGANRLFDEKSPPTHDRFLLFYDEYFSKKASRLPPDWNGLRDSLYKKSSRKLAVLQEVS